MKIAIVTEILSAHSGARAPIEIAKGLANLGNSVVILALEKNSDLALKEELEDKSIKIILIAGHKLLASTKLFLTLRKLVPEIISFQGTFPFFLASKLTGIPIVKTYYGTQLDAYLEKIFPKTPNLFELILNFLANRLITAIEKIQFILSTEVIAISKFAKFQAEKLYQTKIQYCYLGASNLPKSKKINIKKHFILTVSRFTPYKGFHNLIKAAIDLPLIIVGSGGSGKYLNYLKRIKGSNCQIFQDIDDSKLAYLYQNCQFLASFDKYPFFGLPIIEAASFGKPAIAMDFGAASELIEDGKTGFIVKNLKEFQKYAQVFFKTPKLSQKMGTFAKIRVTKLFTWSKTANYYNQIFKKILAKNIKKIPSFKLISAIIGLGIIIRILYLNHHDFWFDEAFSYFVAKESLSNLIQAVAADNHPPFYFLLLHFWMRIFGASVLALRSLSLVFGVLSIPAIFWLGKLLFNHKIGLISSLILAVSPLMVYFSTETRMYSLFVFLTILLISFFVIWLKNQSWDSSLVFMATFTLLLHTHYYAYLLFLPLNLIFLAFRKNLSIWPRFLLLQIPVVLANLPWLVIYFSQAHPPIFAQNLPIALPATFASFILGGTGIVTLRDFLSGNLQASIIAIFSLTIILFGTIFLKFLKSAIFQTKNPNYKFLVFLIFLPIFFLVLTSLVATPIYVVRPVIFLAPLFYLAIGVTLANFGRNFRLILISTLTLLITVTLIQRINPNFSGPPLKQAIFAAQNSPILHTSILTYYPAKYYLPEADQILVTKNPLTGATVKIIGGQTIEIENFNQNLVLVEIENGADPAEVLLAKSKLTKQYKISEVKNFGEITLTHFER